MSTKFGIVIPVFNVEKTIGRVLEAMTADVLANVDEILLIDNCSQDSTVAIIEKFMKADTPTTAKLSLLKNHKNYGYGRSLKTGLTYFLNRSVSHVMILHGDYQINPAKLMREFNQTLAADPNLDLILACRFMKGSDLSQYNWLRRLGNHFFNFVTFLCTGHWMPDSGTAMIVVRPEILNKIPYEILTESMQFHPQLNVLFYDIPNIKLKEIPLDWADSDAPSSIRVVSYGWTLLKMLVRYRFMRTVLGYSPEQAFDAKIVAREFPTTLLGRGNLNPS